MSKLVIGYKNLIPSGAVAVVAPGESAAGFPVENLQASDPFLPWISSGTMVAVQVDFGSVPSDAVELIVAIGTNMTDAGTFLMFSDSTEDGSSGNVFQSGSQGFDTSRGNPLGFFAPAGRDAVYLPGQDIGNRYLRETFLDDDNPAGYIRVGLWWAGPTWAPATGKGFTWRDETDYTAEGKARRRFALSWRHLPRAQGAALKSILHKLAGMGRVYLVLQDEETAQWHLEAMLCTISQVQETPVEDYVQISCVALEADW